LPFLYIIGGGRWARIVAKASENFLIDNLIIKIISKKNYKNMVKWKLNNSNLTNVFVMENLPTNLEKNSFVYVANESSRRIETLNLLQNQNIPILVEKPLFLNSQIGETLINEFKQKNLTLLSAQVFRFMKSIIKVKELIGNSVLDSIEIYWFDPINELRHGEEKKVELDVPIYFDIMPHIFSLMYEFFGTPEIKLVKSIEIKNTNIFNVDVDINNEIPVSIFLSKSSSERLRVINFWIQDQLINYDFSSDEVVSIFSPSKKPEISNYGSSYPLGIMLNEFFNSKNGYEFDSRFNLAPGLNCIKICEEIRNGMEVF
jgi:hypothetical protein